MSTVFPSSDEDEQQEVVLLSADLLERAMAGLTPLTRNELAVYFRVVPRTISEWCEAGMPYMRASRIMRFNLPEVLEWLSRNSVSTDNVA